MVRASQGNVYLQVVPVKLIAQNGRHLLTHALLDSGSQSTLIKEEIAKKLDLKGQRKKIGITTIKDKGEKIMVQEVSLEIASTDGEVHMKVESAYVVPTGKFNMPSQELAPSYQDGDIYTHLDGIDLEGVKADDIAILIGANVPEAIIPLEVRRGSKDQPLALRTKFGWTLFGPSHDVNIQNYVCNFIHTAEDDNKMHTMVEQFWMQENYGTSNERDVGMSIQDKEAEKRLDMGTKMVDRKYQVPMLWKNDEVSLPNNLPQARKRLDFLLKRLRADDDLYQKYKDTFKQYLEMGYARKLSTEEEQRTTPRTWYLPHHPIVNPNKPGKIRVVFDAAAKFKGRSLNEALITGPDLLNSLIGVLLRFRQDQVAIAADIEAMFHQVKVTERDADSLRFLWKENLHSDDPPVTMQMLVHIFGAKDSPCCANFAIKSAARDNYEDFNAITYESALKSFYADDLLKSVKNEEMAKMVAKELMEMMQRGGFRLTKFLSNRKGVLESLPTSEISTSIEFGLDKENVERTLGIWWEINQDIFTFRSNIVEAPVTKRGILRTISSIFDPLGFLGPYIIKAKIFVQELWRNNYSWDDEIDESCSQYWKAWLEGAKNIKRFQLERCYSLEEGVAEIQLHIFGDASELAYGAVAYLRFTSKAGHHKSILVMSKSKLAPIKTITLPRLELNAAVLAVRMYRKLIHELDMPIQRSFFWTDSMLTLQYIRNEKQRFRIYIANRATEILEVTSKDQWNYVASEQNPADIITRGVTDPTKLMETDKFGKCWVLGPAFLAEDECRHPEQPPIIELDLDDAEIKRKKCLVTSCNTEVNFIDVDRFSKWSRLKRAVAWSLRFMQNCKQKRTKLNLMKGHLTIEEISNATNLIIKELQQEVFSDEITIIQAGRTVPLKNALSSLSPLIDSCGIIRVGGRLKHAPISEEAKHPFILPKFHHVTKLIIRYEHELNGHIGREHVLAKLRQFCWILNARSAIKSVLHKCFPCKVRRAKEIKQLMADLPEGRLAVGEPPFTNTGVDLFGPIYIKQGRKRLKRWGVIFTCLTVRCVHLEVVEQADTDAFISTLRRFVNRRGKPKVMHSDCGTNFKGATKELKDLLAELNHEEIGNYSAENGMKWRFNPPSAPHMGGVWERLVRSVKEVMMGIMKDQVLTEFQLATLLTEVESILNTRPLTHTSEDPNDFDALTPNHVLIGIHRTWHEMGEYPERFSSRKKWKQVQYLTDCFWKRWRLEYLPLLTTRATGREKLPNHSVGDLVIVRDASLSRGKWPLGRITKVMPGRDGIVRVAEVRTKNGSYVRPIVKLYRLEENEVPHVEGYVPASEDRT